MRIFYDTEFIEDGTTIDLISIGAVDDAGREFYAVSTEFDPSKASQWVKDNVLVQLPWDRRDDPNLWMTRRALRSRLLDFLAPTENDLELWAYYAAYDHVALAQLWGPMMDLPDGVPMQTDDLMTLWKISGRPERPPQVNQHDALDDARWNRKLYRVCAQQGKS